VIDGRYLLHQLLGAGGVGMVYLADDVRNGHRVALKLAHSRHNNDAQIMRHFNREAMIGMRVAHGSVVSARDVGVTSDGTPFVVMEYVAGRSLAAMLAAERPLFRRGAKIMEQILDGLHAMHHAGFVHADVKCDNVLVATRPDGTDRATLIDLGLAHVYVQHLKTGSIDASLSGTPEYMAPEIISSHGAVPASDIYAAGVILYELLTGTTPFSGGTPAEIMRRHVHEEVVPPSVRCPEGEIPPALDRVVLRALAKNPSARYPTASALAVAITAATPETELPRFRAGAQAEPRFSTSTTIRSTMRGLASMPERPTGTVDSRPIRRARAELARALRAGDRNEIITACLELVWMLVEQHRMLAASWTLEQTIDILTEGAGADTPQAHGPIWRLALTLAAVYDGLGDPIRARSMARAAQRQAVRSGSEVGCERARELLERFAGSGRFAQHRRDRVDVSTSA